MVQNQNLIELTLSQALFQLCIMTLETGEFLTRTIIGTIMVMADIMMVGRIVMMVSMLKKIQTQMDTPIMWVGLKLENGLVIQ